MASALWVEGRLVEDYILPVEDCENLSLELL